MGWRADSLIQGNSMGVPTGMCLVSVVTMRATGRGL